MASQWLTMPWVLSDDGWKCARAFKLKCAYDVTTGNRFKCDFRTEGISKYSANNSIVVID